MNNNIVGIENTELKGFTIKNYVITIVTTGSILISVMCTYFALKEDVQAVRSTQETTNRVNELRLKTLEDRVLLLEEELHEFKQDKVK